MDGFGDFIGKRTLCDAYHKEHASHLTCISGHICPSRARTRTARSVVEHTNHDATLPNMYVHLYPDDLKLIGHCLPVTICRGFIESILNMKRVPGFCRPAKHFELSFL